MLLGIRTATDSFPSQKHDTKFNEQCTFRFNMGMSSVGMGTNKYFHSVVCSFYWLYQTNGRCPFFLVLDGHYSHTRNIEVIEMARQNHVSIMCLPPHATHKMQPLDVGYMAPLKTYYAQEIETFLRHNPGKMVTKNNICSLFSAAYNRTATMVFINPFRKNRTVSM